MPSKAKKHSKKKVVRKPAHKPKKAKNNYTAGEAEGVKPSTLSSNRGRPPEYLGVFAKLKGINPEKAIPVDFSQRDLNDMKNGIPKQVMAMRLRSRVASALRIGRGTHVPDPPKGHQWSARTDSKDHRVLIVAVPVIKAF